MECERKVQVARTSAILDIRIQAASVHTGSDVKDGKLKGKDFFDAEQSPLIRFHSTKVAKTGPETVEFDGNFTIRGVTRREKLKFRLRAKGVARRRSRERWPSTASNTG